MSDISRISQLIQRSDVRFKELRVKRELGRASLEGAAFRRAAKNDLENLPIIKEGFGCKKRQLAGWSDWRNVLEVAFQVAML